MPSGENTQPIQVGACCLTAEDIADTALARVGRWSSGLGSHVLRSRDTRGQFGFTLLVRQQPNARGDFTGHEGQT